MHPRGQPWSRPQGSASIPAAPPPAATIELSTITMRTTELCRAPNATRMRISRVLRLTLQLTNPYSPTAARIMPVRPLPFQRCRHPIPIAHVRNVLAHRAQPDHHTVRICFSCRTAHCRYQWQWRTMRPNRQRDVARGHLGLITVEERSARLLRITGSDDLFRLSVLAVFYYCYSSDPEGEWRRRRSTRGRPCSEEVARPAVQPLPPDATCNVHPKMLRNIALVKFGFVFRSLWRRSWKPEYRSKKAGTLREARSSLDLSLLEAEELRLRRT
jgi:hypothetical protein